MNTIGNPLPLFKLPCLSKQAPRAPPLPPLSARRPGKSTPANQGGIMTHQKDTNLKLVETQQNGQTNQRELRQKRHQRRSPMARYPFADMSRREAERYPFADLDFNN